jgi:hypothetical protein
METGQRLVDRMPTNPRTVAFISTQERYSQVLLIMYIFFLVTCSRVFTLVNTIWSVGLRFPYAPSCGLILHLVLFLLRTCSSATTGSLASTPPSLGVGGLNPSDEGVILLMIPLVLPVDLMLGRRDVPRLAHQVDWNAQLSSRLGWLIITMRRAKERYCQSILFISLLLMETPILFDLFLNYHCFHLLSISSLSLQSYGNCLTDWPGPWPEKMTSRSMISLFNPISNTSNYKINLNHNW